MSVQRFAALFTPDTTRPYDVLLLNEWKADLIPALRKANPAVKVLLYKNTMFLRSDDNASTVGGVEAAPEAWFQHDAAGNRLTYQYYPGIDFYPMRWDHPDWQAHWASRSQEAATRLGFDGIFGDDCYVKRNSAVANSADYPDSAAVQRAVRSFLAYQYPRKGNLLMVYNVASDSYAYPGLWADLLTVSDGLMEEHFGRWGKDAAAGYADPARTKTTVDYVAQCEARGKLGLFVTPGPEAVGPTCTYGYGLYLLGCGGKTAYVYTPGGSTSVPPGVSPEYIKDLGAPQGPYVMSGPGVFARAFERGAVRVDTNAHTATVTQTVTPPPSSPTRLDRLELEHRAVMTPYARRSGYPYVQVDRTWREKVLSAGRAVDA